MILIKKLAPRRLSRAIVALVLRSGNKVMHAVQPGHFLDRNQNEDVRSRIALDRGHAQLKKRTTVTLETETLLVVRSERRSSATSAERRTENLPVITAEAHERDKQP